MVFNTFNWIALVFLVISFAYTNTEVYRSKIKELKREIEKTDIILRNTSNRLNALDKLISKDGYDYYGGVSHANHDGSILEYSFYDLHKADKKKEK